MSQALRWYRDRFHVRLKVDVINEGYLEWEGKGYYSFRRIRSCLQVIACLRRLFWL